MTKQRVTSIVIIGGMILSTVSIHATVSPYTVIPSNNEKQIIQLKKQIYNIFNTKYTANLVYLNNQNSLNKPAYQIQIGNTLDDIDSSEYLTSYAEFEEIFNEKYSNLKYNQKIIVRYTTVSRTLDNGEVVDYKNSKYLGNEDEIRWSILEDGTKIGKITISSDTSTGEPRFINVKVGDIKLDINKPIFREKNGYYIDKNGYSIKKVDKKVIETITTLPNGVIDGYYEDTSLPLEEEDKIQNTDAIVKYADEITEEILNADEIYEINTGRLTVKANELFKSIRSLTNTNKSKYTITLEGIDKILDEPREIYIDKSDNNNILVKYVDNNIEVNPSDLSKINLIIEEETSDNKYIIKQYIIKPVRKIGIDKILDIMIGNIDLKIYAGTNRYKTSVEVSKNTYNQSNNVVLVSGDDNSLVDGLTATPLAATLDAPILLTKQDQLPLEVIDEIKRLGAKNIYIVGGKGVVSENIQLQLERYYGKNVTRLYGKDRYETSLAVAEEITKKATSKVDTFIVGGNGEADALSISPVAGSKSSPIILTKKDELSYDAKYFINKYTDKAYIVGGSGVVSNNISYEIVDMKIPTKRLAGERRQDTNAAVIKEFYGKDKELYNNGGIILAKSNNEGLVDSLSAGALGANIDAPIVLATDNLTINQEDSIQNLKSKSNKVQVGYGVSSNVAEFLK